MLSDVVRQSVDRSENYPLHAANYYEQMDKYSNSNLLIYLRERHADSEINAILVWAFQIHFI